MNEAEKANPESDVFLQQVRLKNYKSIIDAEIDFKPGLNIIIGNNGSGKTNFLNGINNFINFNYTDTLDSESTVQLSIGTKKILIDHFIKNDLFSEELLDYDRDRYESSLKINEKQIKLSKYQDAELYLLDKYYILSSNLIGHGIPYKKSSIIDTPISFTAIINNKRSRELTDANIENTLFLKRFTYDFLNEVFHNTKGKLTLFKSLKKNILNFDSRAFLKLNDFLHTYTLINAIRINPNFNTINDVELKRILISNFYLDYSINNNWYTFDLLSDGTKRLFYLLSELLSVDQNEKKQLEITLLEEPELGIHPHQLHKLMLFIKEQSKEKQIILTTHSPQVLNILDADELDRIIICSYDKEKGTQLNHLTETQIKKGQMYMQDEGFLSDYWVHSDLEPAS